MPGKEKTQNNSTEERKRYPSRPSKGTVSDIAAAFKKQMAMANPPKSPVSEKPNTTLRSSTRNKAKDNKKTLKQSLTETSSQESVIEEGAELPNDHDELSQEEEESEQDNECVENNVPPSDKKGTEEGVKANTDISSKDASTSAETLNKDAHQLEIMECLKEIKTALNKVENAIFDPKNGIEVQLGKTIQRVDDIYTDIHGAVDGIKTRLNTVEENSLKASGKIDIMESSIARLSKLLDDNKKITQQLGVMQGIIQKFAQHNISTSAKINDLTKRGMEQNLIIHGIEELSSKQKENCRERTLEFVSENLDITIDSLDIWKAHHMGLRRDNHVRPMIVKVAYHTKELIMENLGKLKGKINRTSGKPLFISEQIPEAISETKKQITARLSTITKKNEALPEEQRKKIQVQNDHILVNGEVFNPEVTTPQPSDLFLGPELQLEVDQINSQFVMTEPINIKNSSFVALALKVNKVEQVRLAYIAAMQRFSSADHVLMAYGLKEDGKLKFGHCDDNEYGGGMVIRKTLASHKAKNTVVFVSRKFGGLHMGYERFKAIEKATQEALQHLG